MTGFGAAAPIECDYYGLTLDGTVARNGANLNFERTSQAVRNVRN